MRPLILLGQKLFFMAIIVMGIYYITYISVYNHELMHQNIYEDYDIDSSIHLDIYLFDSYTRADNITELKENCDLDCKFKQQLVDIIGRHIIMVFLLLAFFGFLYFYYHMFIKDENI